LDAENLRQKVEAEEELVYFFNNKAEKYLKTHTNTQKLIKSSFNV
jgi:hypothetical protein